MATDSFNTAAWTPISGWTKDGVEPNNTVANLNLTLETSNGSGGGSPNEIFLLVAIIIGLLSISIILFVMAFVIDRRYQRLKEEATNTQPKRISQKKSRIPVFIANGSSNNDALAFASEMCNENCAFAGAKKTGAGYC